MKSEQLQIRVTPQEKAALRRHARAASVDVSTYVLSRALPLPARRFTEIVESLRDEGERKYALASLNDFLVAIAPMEFSAAVASVDLSGLPPLFQNYVAAMVEQAASRKHVPPPAWIPHVVPLQDPYFAAPLRSLRAYLLRVSPVPFKRRNIFIDASIGARV